MEQFTYLQSSGLLEQISDIYILLISKEDARIASAVELIKSYPVMSEIDYSVNIFRNDYKMMYSFKGEVEDQNIEAMTLHRLYNDSQSLPDDTKMLYFHSKGVTSYLQNIPLGKIIKHRDVHYWRNLMNWACLTNWRTCTKALDTYDVASINYTVSDSDLSMFTGNFWWARADHIRRLKDPVGNEWNLKWETIRKGNIRRVKDEVWVLSNPETKVFDLLGSKNSELQNKMIPFNQLEPLIVKV